MCFSMSASCSSRRAPSKMPPQLGGAPAQLVVASFEVVEVERQRNLLVRLNAGRGNRLMPGTTQNDERKNDECHRHVSHGITDRRVNRAAGKEPCLLDQTRLLKDS